MVELTSHLLSPAGFVVECTRSLSDFRSDELPAFFDQLRPFPGDWMVDVRESRCALVGVGGHDDRDSR